MMLHNPELLCIFYCWEPFNLYCDSSALAVGDLLTQMDNKGMDPPASFIRQKLNDAQMTWATVYNEAYAIIVWAK